MMRLAQIEDGQVVNVIAVDGAQIPAWCASWPDAGPAGPGWLWVDGAFIAPEGAPEAGPEAPPEADPV